MNRLGLIILSKRVYTGPYKEILQHKSGNAVPSRVQGQSPRRGLIGSGAPKIRQNTVDQIGIAKIILILHLY